MALPHVGAQFGGTSQPTFQRVYVDLKGYKVFHQEGRGRTTLQGHQRSYSKLHQGEYNHVF